MEIEDFREIEFQLPTLDLAQRYTLDEANLYLRQSRSTTYKQISAGQICVLKVGKRVYIPGTEIARLSRAPVAENQPETISKPETEAWEPRLLGKDLETRNWEVVGRCLQGWGIQRIAQRYKISIQRVNQILAWGRRKLAVTQQLRDQPRNEDMSVNALRLRKRSRTVLESAGLSTVGQIYDMGFGALLATPGCGRETFMDIICTVMHLDPALGFEGVCALSKYHKNPIRCVATEVALKLMAWEKI